KALADSEDYADQLHDLKLRRIGVDESARMITTYDVRLACDVLRPAYDATHGVDGRVSIEVDPRLADETDRTIAEAKQLWWLVDTEVDKRLDKIGSPEAQALHGKAAIANARLAYQRYEKVFTTRRWQALADAGAHPQRPLWASTSTKNPAYRDVMYVEELIA